MATTTFASTRSQPDRLQRAAAHGVTTRNLEEEDDLPAAVRELTGGRAPISVIDAVGMEAHGAPVGRFAHLMADMLPDAVSRKVIETGGIDRLTALHMARELVQRGGTISISGVYGGGGGGGEPDAIDSDVRQADHLRIGQANVRRWTDTLMPLLTDDGDPLDVDTFATHQLALDEAPQAYETFQKKQDGEFKVVLNP